jgi:signal transduction histidine kinase
MWPMVGIVLPVATRLSGRAHAAVFVSAAVTIAAEAVGWGGGVATTDPALLGFLVTAPIFLAVPWLGATLVQRYPVNPVGWIFCVAGVAFSVLALSTAYAYLGLSSGRNVPAAHWIGLVSSIVWIYSIPLVGSYGALLYPDGRLPGPRWRPLAWAVAAMLAGLPLGVAFSTEVLTPLPYESPLALPGQAGNAASALLVFLIFIPLTTSVAAVSLVLRAHRSNAALRLPAFAACLVGLSFIGCIAWPGGEPGVFVPPEAAAVLVCVVAAAIAITRHGLFDVRLVVSHALRYLVLSACVLAISALAVVVFGEVVDGRAPLFLAAATAALAVQPLHRYLQGRIEKLIWGTRRRPYEALATLGRQIAASPAPADMLPSVAEGIATVLRSPYVAIEIPGLSNPVVAVGVAGTGQSVSLDLVVQGELVGALVVESSDQADRFTRSDLDLLQALAPNVAVAARTVELAAGLQESRERLVLAREDERRRLRRDIHDGLGPALAAVGLGIDTARGDLPEGRPRELLDAAREDLDETLDDIRRLVHALRPPALDQLGLLGALSQEASRPPCGGPTVRVDSPALIRDLPAATEVAAYRIAIEAITNARRHSGARTCTVHVALNGDLDLEIRDDGRGTDGCNVGVGMTSMRERAAEIGGSVTITPLNPGTSVRAILPLEPA